MRKLYNTLSLVVNSIVSVALIASIAVMIVYESTTAFASLTMYVTILALVSCIITNIYAIKNYKAGEYKDPKWSLILRLVSVTSILVNMIITVALVPGGILDLSYILSRIAAPILMLISFCFFEIGNNVPFIGTAFAPIPVTLFLIIAFSLYGTNTFVPPYEYLAANTNSWVVTVLTLICVAAVCVLLSAILKGVNYCMHQLVYGPQEKQAQEEQKRLIEQEKEVAELEEEAELKQVQEEEVEKQETVLEQSVIEEEHHENDTQASNENNDSISSLKDEKAPEETIDVEPNLKEESTQPVNKEKSEPVEENKFEKEPEALIKKTSKAKTTTKKKTTGKTSKKSASKKPETIDESNQENETSKTEITSDVIKTAPIPASKRVYHISHHKTENKWQVKVAGATRAMKLFKTQLEAINYAKEIVKTKGGSIRIHSVNGQIRKG